MVLAEVDLDLAVLALRDRRVQLCLFEHLASSGGALRHKGTTSRRDWQVCALRPVKTRNIA
jgi:hypothetical protein